MLGKLIKYDFKAMSKNMFPLYVVLLALTTIFSLMVKFHIDEGFVFSIFAMLFIVALNGSIIACAIFVINRFSKGLLKNEGYLSFALPVSTAQHIVAKVINAVIWAFIEGMMLFVCMLIMGAIMGSIEGVAEFLREMMKALGLIEKDVLLQILQMIVILMLEMIASICLIYAAMAVGHLFEKHQKMVIVLFLVVIVVLRSFVLSHVIDIVEASSMPPFSRQIHPLWFIVPIVFTVLYSALTWFILDRRLNLE